MQEKIKLIYPEYLDKFKCIGGKCTDTCCSGWGIYIDKNTFEKYNEIKELEYKKFITENIHIRENCRNENIAYAEIKLNKDRRCPFLDDDNYCMIQKKYGEDYLSKVCSTFPRIINKVNDTYEISLNISCMEAARTALLNKEKMKFKSDLKSEIKYEPQSNVDTNDESFDFANDKHITPINRFSIALMQDRNFNVYERMYKLGFSLEYISNKLCYDFDRIDDIMCRCSQEAVFRKKSRDKMDYMMQISFFKNLLQEIEEEDLGLSKNLKNIINDCKKGFMFSDGRSLMEKSHIYVQAYGVIEDNINKKYSHIFENYIVNHIFQSLFPFLKSDIMINDYIMLCLRYSLIVFLCVGKYLYNGAKFHVEDILLIMQSLSKETEHSDKFIDKVESFMRKNDLFNDKFAKTLL